MARIFHALSAFLALSVTGCAALTKETCLNGSLSPLSEECRSIIAERDCSQVNWFERGRLLAFRGENPARDNRANECRSFGSFVNEDKLAAGFKSGLESLCQGQEGQAWSIGFNGGAFREYLFCSKEANEKARVSHAKGLSAYCEPQSGRKIGRENKSPHKKCGLEWDRQYQLGKRDFHQAKVDALSAREKELRNNYYRLKRERINLSERKLRITGENEAANKMRQDIEIEILDVDRELLKLKQEQEILNSEILEKKSNI